MTCRAAAGLGAILLSILTLQSPSANAAPPACPVSPGAAALSAVLPRVADSLAVGHSLRVVAVGSSSTAGAGASDAAHSYPARLSEHLGRLFPGVTVTVLNKGVNGEVGSDMLGRFQRDVIDERPDLVVWQVAANSVLRGLDPDGAEQVIRDGVRRLKDAGPDVVLMDLQYAPAMLAKPAHADVEARVAHIAADEGVGLFRRFALMRGWVEAEQSSMSDLVGPDGIHHNDFGYDCVARALAAAIGDAAGHRLVGHAALRRP